MTYMDSTAFYDDREIKVIRLITTDNNVKNALIKFLDTEEEDVVLADEIEIKPVKGSDHDENNREDPAFAYPPLLEEIELDGLAVKMITTLEKASENLNQEDLKSLSQMTRSVNRHLNDGRVIQLNLSVLTPIPDNEKGSQPPTY